LARSDECVLLHHVALHVGHHGVQAADREAGKQQEMPEEAAKVRSHHFFLRQAKAIAKGASAPITGTSDQRSTPTAMNATTRKTHGRMRRGSAAASVMPFATRSPAATDTMPLKARSRIGSVLKR